MLYCEKEGNGKLQSWSKQQEHSGEKREHFSAEVKTLLCRGEEGDMTDGKDTQCSELQKVTLHLTKALFC